MTNHSEAVDIVIIGAGVVGAATAELLARQGQSVIILEAHSLPAEGITSRNSGVIHSGIYYPPDSLKAKLCIEGKELLYRWVKQNNIPHQQCGKLIVATNTDEQAELYKIYENAKASGATDISLISKGKLQDKLHGGLNHAPLEAIWAESTGIVDATALTNSLLDAACQDGALLLTNSKVDKIDILPGGGYTVHTTRGPITSQIVINTAGLQSDEIAHMVGIHKYKIYPCRGDYFWLNSPIRHKHLIYPVKAKNAPGLGIHLTLDMSGRMRLGPDTEYVESKTDYAPKEDKLDKFLLAAQHLLGPVRREQLSYDQCGIRPKLRSPHDATEKDFVISMDLPGFVNLIGIESPGLTSSMAIAAYVSRLLKNA